MLSVAEIRTGVALRRSLIQDGLLAAAVAVLSLASLFNPPQTIAHDFRDADPLGVALSLLGPLAIFVRGRAPLAAWGAALVACLLLVRLGYSQTLGGLPVLFTLYTVTVRTRLAVSASVALTTIASIGVVLLDAPLRPSTGDWIANGLVLTLGWSFGRTMRYRRARTATVDARDEAIAAAETAHRNSVELQRRAEIAQEVQDLAAHNLTQMTVQMAGARRMVDRDPELAKATLAQAEEAGRAAMQELRLLFDVLKSSEHAAQFTPAPRLDELEDLVANERARGVDVVLSIRGNHHDVPAGVGLSMFRVAEEALSNARQHADGQRVDVHLRRSADELVLLVASSGPTTFAAAQSDPMYGGGLSRLQSRLRLYGGTLTWGNHRDGGFLVEARVPIDHVGG